MTLSPGPVGGHHGGHHGLGAAAGDDGWRSGSIEAGEFLVLLGKGLAIAQEHPGDMMMRTANGDGKSVDQFGRRIRESERAVDWAVGSSQADASRG